MDFVCDNYLNKKGAIDKELEAFANIYQQLGLAWEFLEHLPNQEGSEDS